MVTELMKSAPFFRLAEQAKPTYLIDEMDVFIEQAETLGPGDAAALLSGGAEINAHQLREQLLVAALDPPGGSGHPTVGHARGEKALDRIAHPDSIASRTR